MLLKHHYKNFLLRSFGLMLGLFIISGIAQAQSDARITGLVIDGQGKPLAELAVILNKGVQRTFTDRSGRFSFTGLAAGKYQVSVMYFHASQQKEISVKAGGSQHLRFVLTNTESELDAVTVSLNKKTIPSSTLRISENLLVTPQNVQVIDQGLIQDQILLSTAEAFTRNVSGARSTYHQEEAAAGVYVRGYSASNLRNGMDVSGSFGPLREDMSFVDRIEFVKGPAGFMMGNTQPGGFYNIVTKKPRLNAASNANLTLGSYGLFRGAVDLNGKLSNDGKLLGRLNLMGTRKNSHVITAGNEQFVINPSIKYSISDKTELTAEYILSQNAFSGGFSKYIYSLEGFKKMPRWFSFNDPIVKPTVIREHNFFGALNHILSDDWMLTAQFGYIRSGMEGNNIYPIVNSLKTNGDILRTYDVADALNTSTVGQLFAKGKVKIGNVDNHILTGLDMGTKFYVADWTKVDTINKVFNINDPVYGNLVASDLPVVDRSKPLRERGAMYLTEYTYYSVHFQDEAHLLNDRLRIGAGVRYTNTSRTSAASKGRRVYNEAVTPRFSLTGLINPTFTAYALYDQTFQEQTGILLSGDPAKPSRGINKEIGLKKSWFNGNLLAGVTAYHLVRTNITTTAGPTNPTLVEQSGEATSKGIEVDINGKISSAINVMFNYAYTDAKITEDNDAARVGLLLPGIARHMSNGWFKYTIQEGSVRGLGFTAGYEFQNKRAAFPVTKEGFLPDNLFTLDLGTSFKRDRYNISVLVSNVTDRYNYTGHYPGAWRYVPYGWRALPPRMFRLSVGYSF